MTTDTRMVPTAPVTIAAVDVLERLQTVRSVLAPDLNAEELQLFALVAQRSGLDPFAKQLYAIKRSGRVTFQTGIDGYRSVAARTGQYEGSSDPDFGEWLDKPFPHPTWAHVIAYRWQNGRRIEQEATAHWDEYYPGRAGQVPGYRDEGFMWLNKPRVMIGKVAEAIALRKAFPYVLADVYIAEEMEQAGPPENAALVKAEAQPTARERIAARRAAIEQPKAEPTEEPVEEGEVVPEPGCGWRLETKAGIEPCTAGELHEGNHSWQETAVREGGRVLRPDA